MKLLTHSQTSLVQPSVNAKLTGPWTAASKTHIEPINLLYIIMFKISKIKPNTTLYWACDYLSMLALRLTHVSKKGPWWISPETLVVGFCVSNTASYHSMIDIYPGKLVDAGIFLCMRPANGRRRYNVTSSLIGWAHTQKIPVDVILQSIPTRWPVASLTLTMDFPYLAHGVSVKFKVLICIAYYIPRNMHMICTLWYFVVVWRWSISYILISQNIGNLTVCSWSLPVQTNNENQSFTSLAFVGGIEPAELLRAVPAPPPPPPHHPNTPSPDPHPHPTTTTQTHTHIMASNKESVSMSWHHHVSSPDVLLLCF